VDPRNVFPSPVSEGVVEMVSVLFTQVLRMGILGSCAFRLSPKFAPGLERWHHACGGEGCLAEEPVGKPASNAIEGRMAP
jgi:hypothetical protein